MLSSNKKYLKEFGDENIFNILNKYNNFSEDYYFEIVTTKKEQKTLLFKKNRQEVFLHSKYDPIREAKSVVDSYKDIEHGDLIFFIGTGLGYHIDIMLEKYPSLNYYIYEPVVGLMEEFLKNFDLTKRKDRLLGFSIGSYGVGKPIEKVIDTNKNIRIVSFPSYEKHFKKEFEEVNNLLLEYLKGKKDSILTNLRFQNRWIINSMKNLHMTLRTQNILKNINRDIKNFKVILVSAGPSLNYEIENLKKVKKDGSMYIFSVGSAINTLIKNNIYPDIAITYDPGVYNYNAMKILREKVVEETCLVYGSTVAYEVVDDYKGKISHVLTTQDSVAMYYLKNHDDFSDYVISDASTVANISLQISKKLGFKEIIFVGQNLAFLNGEKHAKGRGNSSKLSKADEEAGLFVEDVFGNKVLTNETYLLMKQELEEYIRKYNNEVSFINTTKYGANIEGAKFVDLSKLLEIELKKQKMEILLENKKEEYSLEYLKKQKNKMDRELEQIKGLNKHYKQILDKISRDIKLKDFSKLEKWYVQLDRQLKKIENNDFYKVFILPTIRVQYEALANDIDRLNSIADSLEKGTQILEKFQGFIDLCVEQIKLLTPIYEDMNEDIIKYMEEVDRNVK